MGDEDMHFTAWIHTDRPGDPVGLQKAAYFKRV